MRTREKQQFAAKAAAPGAVVPQAELFIISISRAGRHRE